MTERDVLRVMQREARAHADERVLATVAEVRVQ